MREMLDFRSKFMKFQPALVFWMKWLVLDRGPLGFLMVFDDRLETSQLPKQHLRSLSKTQGVSMRSRSMRSMRVPRAFHLHTELIWT